MCYLLRQAVLPQLKKKLCLNDKPFQQTIDEVLFTYFKEGEMRFYTLRKGGEAEIVLYDRGLISNYEGTGSHMKMYKKRIDCKMIDKVPVMWVTEIELPWENVTLTNDDIIDIVANWEYELAGHVLGFYDYKPKGKIRSIEVPYKVAM